MARLCRDDSLTGRQAVVFSRRNPLSRLDVIPAEAGIDVFLFFCGHAARFLEDGFPPPRE
jgi:hypothetical protein